MIARMTYARDRIGKRDIAIAVVMSGLGVFLMSENMFDRLADGRSPNPDERAAVHIGALVPYELAIPLFLLVTVPLLWRRAAPIAAVSASLAGMLVNILLLGTELIRCGVVLPTAFLFAFTAGAQLGKRDSRIGLALAEALVLIEIPLELGPIVAVVFAGVLAVIWATGRIVHSRHRMADELEVRSAELREARDERARLEVAADRARLSRELDELLQRRLGELARMADSGAQPENADATTATLVDIERESRRTLEEMRAVVGVLRDDESVDPNAPQPTLTHLEALLVRAKGDDAQLRVEGNPRVLPAAVELSAYRIVEQLLEGLEEAPDVAVRVRFCDDALELEVSGPARRRAKAAFERARERARLQRGTLDTRLHDGRADAVVSLPVVTAG
jgi:signal transduction histidine kinase